MKQLRIGIVGMGIRGKLYAQTLAQSPYAKLQAISDSSSKTLELSTKQFNVQGYTQVEEMLDAEELDALIVATPDYLHRNPVLTAARRGVHLLIEKPFSTSVEEAEEMVAVIEQAGVKCMIAFENRWNSPFVAVKEAIDNGEIGKIININSRLNDTIEVPTTMIKWSQNSTPGWFLFPHSIDLALWLKQVKPTQVFAVGTKKKLIGMGIDTYDSIQAIMSFEDNTHATFTSSWVLPEHMPMIYDFKYEIIGEKGAFYVDLAEQMVRQVTDRYKHMHTLGTSINKQLTGAASYMLHDFIDHLRLDRMPEASAREGLLNTRIVDAIHRSIEQGTVQYLS
ncbi:Gfo/Idh/MocA family protein [Paenibacillus yanchengensis]|uniref:Gfo/Idh/MocA family protein n=1 Tax=Paenibacillus yanchengensis TaxID=2035833 RepID=A0ABW4YF71_9BACL